MTSSTLTPAQWYMGGIMLRRARSQPSDCHQSKEYEGRWARAYFRRLAWKLPSPMLYLRSPVVMEQMFRNIVAVLREMDVAHFTRLSLLWW